MKKIKILRIIARLNIGGPAIHVILLNEGLDNSKFESLLVYGSPGKSEGEMLDYACSKNIRLHFIPELKRELSFINDLIAFFKLLSVIGAEKPDIIHTHTAKAGTLGRLAGMTRNLFSKNKAKLVHTFHGHVFRGYFNKMQSRFFVIVERFLALFTSRVITVSEEIKKELLSLRICPERNISVIPLGFELEKLLDIVAREDSLVNVGIVGRLAPVKNHRLFLRAVAQIIKNTSGLKVRVKVIGDGELRGELEEYSKELKIDPFVDFLGWQRDLAVIYSGLDIVALTSINEGTPVSLIEAMASARAIAATDVGGVRGLLGDILSEKTGNGNIKFEILERGVIVGSSDYLSFTAALSFLLLNKDLRRQMGLAGREFVKSKFTKDRLIKDIENLYYSVPD